MYRAFDVLVRQQGEIWGILKRKKTVVVNENWEVWMDN
jgi:hypothetical protein